MANYAYTPCNIKKISRFNVDLVNQADHPIFYFAVFELAFGDKEPI